MTTIKGIARAQEYLHKHGLDGWLVYDFQGSNPIFQEVMGEPRHNSRPCFLLISREGLPEVLVHHVDAGKYAGTGATVRAFLSREDRLAKLAELLRGRREVAMEYSPQALLPAISRVDAGTIEVVRSCGVEIVSSGDLVQHALYRLDAAQLAAHKSAAAKLAIVASDAFAYIGARIATGLGEYEVRDFMRQRCSELGLYAEDGPVVAVNEHSGDPHYEPTAASSTPIKAGDWVLIDFWGKEENGGMYADMTWVGYVGKQVPEEHQRIFDVVAAARDRAISFLAETSRRGEVVAGWQVDRAARDRIAAAGYAEYFTHRLGHSIGPEVHASGVNLDDFETKDTRLMVPGTLVTVEPGIYLPAFGVRSEINVFLSSDGPVVTTVTQKSPSLIE